MSGNSKQYYESGSQVDMGLCLVRAIVQRARCGDYKCPTCGTHYNPTYGSCPNCRRFTGAPADWPNEDAVTVIEARHRGPQVEAVSWNTGPVLFDRDRKDWVGL